MPDDFFAAAMSAEKRAKAGAVESYSVEHRATMSPTSTRCAQAVQAVWLRTIEDAESNGAALSLA